MSLKQLWKLSTSEHAQLATSGTSQTTSIVVDAGLDCDLTTTNIDTDLNSIRNNQRERRNTLRGRVDFIRLRWDY
jgi:ABC-type sulfate transport system substrate-binding protein